MELARARQPDVIVTVDNGIASLEGVAHARALGLRVLVTDPKLVAPMQERAKKLQHVLAEIVDIGVAAEFLPARVSVFAATAEDVDVSRRHLDIAFLRNRKVLDLRG